MKIINIEATTISDAWFQTLYSCIENGEIVASSKGASLYDYVFELAEILNGKNKL